MRMEQKWFTMAHITLLEVIHIYAQWQQSLAMKGICVYMFVQFTIKHLRIKLNFQRIAKDPIQLVTYLCIFQAALVAFEFWLLLLTSDWQQIVTLVLLMFANYLLLAKMFKDRIIIGRIYNPSEEDLQMIKQLKEEMEQKKTSQK